MTDPRLVAQVTGRLRAAGCVFAEDEARLLVDAASGAGLEPLVSRRVSGQPLEQVLGWVEFAGRRLVVADGVFVPRRRTELLAAQAVEAARRCGTEPVVVELCCGAGPVAAVVLAAVPAAVVHAVDIDPVAVRCARRNLPSARVHTGDLYGPLPPDLRGRVDVLVANAPYVPTAELPLMPREARDYEPASALDGGEDGVVVQRRVIAAAPDWLAPAGRVLVETSARQARLTVDAVRAAGLEATTVVSEELDATVVVGARAAQVNRA